MTELPPNCSEVLTQLEDLEMPLLVWGMPQRAFLSRSDIEDAINDAILRELEHGAVNLPSVDEYLDSLLTLGLLHKEPNSSPERYRTRFAEYVRLLRLLKQLFPRKDLDKDYWWNDGKPLVSDYRLKVSPRLYPRRDISPDDVAERLRETIGNWTERREAVTRNVLGRRNAARFQMTASQAILQTLQDGGSSAGFIVTAGTGSGKTLAFYLPAFVHLSAGLTDSPTSIHTLALYPRNELLRDQARECVRMALSISRDPKTADLRPIRIGLLYGSTPPKARDATVRGFYTWTKTSQTEGDYICPYFACPEENCDGDLVWTNQDNKAGLEVLLCRQCGWRSPEGMLALTRQTLESQPPDILFTSTEMLSLNSTNDSLARLLGWRGPSRPSLVLLDEAHTYSGVHGAQVALMLRRWRQTNRSKRKSVFVGLSATLKNPEGFFARLTGIDEAFVEGITPSSDELEPTGREYSLVVRGDPMSGASLLSTTIQTSMLSGRILDRDPGLFGSSAFVFADDLDVINRLFDDLTDAERKALADLRLPSQPQALRRYSDGQNWELPSQLRRMGHPLRVGITSSQSSGVDTEADLIVATASLEVGFNDPRVGLIIQHKTPRDAASFIQRRGRAGRTRDMRPITVVVLSDYGRDQIAYQTYEQLLDPDIDSRNIPVGNRYVLKIQGTHALLDWVYLQTGLNIRWLMVKPGEGKAPHINPTHGLKLCRFLEDLLTDGSVQNRLAAHLKHALSVSDNDALAIMWDEPRSLMMSVVPTMLRRIESQWKVADNDDPDPGAESSKPLPEFMTNTLFDPLNVPDVELVMPEAFQQRNLSRNTSERMDILRALRETVPGRVSHRFGYDRHGDRTWLPLPEDSTTLDLTLFVTGQLQGTWCGLSGNQWPVVRPLQLQLFEPPQRIDDSSNAQPIWDSQFVFPEAQPIEFDVPSPSPWDAWVRKVEFHTHSTGSQVLIRRMSPGAVCDTSERGVRTTKTLDYAYKDQPAALGFDGTHDALVISAEMPPDWEESLAPVIDSPAWRTLAFKRRVAEDHRLDNSANFFQRTWLAEIYLNAMAITGLSSGNPSEAVTDVDHGVWARNVQEYLSVVYRDDTPSVSGISRPEAVLVALACDPAVQSVIEEHAQLLGDSDVLTLTTDLVQRAIADTLANAVSTAASALLADSGDVDLTADVVWDKEGTGFRVVLSESSTGGLGLLEQLISRYARNPRVFWEKVATVVGPSEYEEVDHILRATLADIVSPSGLLWPTVDALLRSSNAIESKANLEELIAQWSLRFGPPSHLEMSTFATRMLRPGSTRGTAELIQSLVKAWDQLEYNLGVEIDVRTFAYAVERGLMSFPPHEHTADEVVSLLWLRGTRARMQRLQGWNPYRTNEVVERTLLEHLAPATVPEVQVTEPAWQDTYCQLLESHGEVDLVAPLDRRNDIAQAVKQCVAIAVEKGPLRVYGRVLSCTQHLGKTHVRVAITEEFQ